MSEKREMPEGLEVQTGACKFCGQMGQVRTSIGWTQESVNEQVTAMCQCEAAVNYAAAKARKENAKKRINELFGPSAEKPAPEDTLNIMLCTVDAIEEKHIKGITIDMGLGVKAKVAKMAKESIKVERSENKKTTYEE